MMKIVCDKDNKESAEIILKLVQKHQICPPFIDCSPAANCDQCIAEWLEIEVIEGITELERLKEQEAMNVDAFVQWCIDNHIVGDATIRGIKYWVGKFKEGR